MSRPLLTDFMPNEVAEDFENQIRAEVIEKCADIMSNISYICGACCPVHCHWGTELTCKEAWKYYLNEQLKENKNE